MYFMGTAVLLHAKIQAKPLSIAGPYYDEHRDVGFKETASLD
jgi:hypothetical protein